ncbi:hypothetical protein V5O48_009271 [Marasmius crinis-equi]|uniref:Fungal-type protein kinase domain-containing protein n=1 Tax=Marasmius crinis-equi TaxID=585013 RepID=A0ABR3FBL5_9AGAR
MLSSKILVLKNYDDTLLQAVVDPAGSSLQRHHSPSTTPEKKAGHDAWSDTPSEHDTARTLRVVLFSKFGTMYDAASSKELATWLVHAHICWLNYLLKGFLHRDISISNVLVLKSRSEVFQVPEGTGRSPIIWRNDLSEEAQTWHKKVTHILAELPITETTSPLAFVTDGDMSANLCKYLADATERGERSGIPEFMSDKLRRAFEMNTHHLHNPIEDLSSLFFVGVWAILFNCRNQPRRTAEEYQWREDLGTGDRTQRCKVIGEIFMCSAEGEYIGSPIVSQWLSTLEKWKRALDELNGLWAREVLRVKPGGQSDTDYFPLRFYEFGLRGLSVVLVPLAELLRQLEKDGGPDF